jgi:hypothetical protein
MFDLTAHSFPPPHFLMNNTGPINKISSVCVYVRIYVCMNACMHMSVYTPAQFFIQEVDNVPKIFSIILKGLKSQIT